MSSLNDRLLLSIVALSLYVFVVFADELLLKDESIDRGAHSDRSGLWFGPRLGKRSSPPAEDERDILQRLLEAAANLKYESDVYEQEIQNEGDKRKLWSKHGRSGKHRQEPRRRYNNNQYNEVDFTPRLGRGLVDDVAIADEDLYFTPRLGRGLAKTVPLSDDELASYYAIRASRQPDFTPRLGRSLTGYPETVRVARSVNKTKS